MLAKSMKCTKVIIAQIQICQTYCIVNNLPISKIPNSMYKYKGKLNCLTRSTKSKLDSKLSKSVKGTKAIKKAITKMQKICKRRQKYAEENHKCKHIQKISSLSKGQLAFQNISTSKQYLICLKSGERKKREKSVQAYRFRLETQKNMENKIAITQWTREREDRSRTLYQSKRNIQTVSIQPKNLKHNSPRPQHINLLKQTKPALTC